MPLALRHRVRPTPSNLHACLPSPTKWLAAGQMMCLLLRYAVYLNPSSMFARRFLGTWVDLRPEESEVVKMAPLLRLAAVNERTMPELAASLAGWSAEPLPTWNKMQVPIGVEVELAIARRVIAQCEEALATLPTTESLAPIALGPRPPDPGSWESEPEPETTAQRRAKLAARVMLGERHAIEVCASVWKRAAAAATAASAAESAA
eukprot:scaffold314491_cov33-Tisochrysis_lutea.AAC.2